MSQDANTSQMLLNSLQSMSLDLSRGEDFGSAEGTQSGKFPVDSYADRLMDELFEDVEGMLSGGAKPPAEPELTEEEPAPPQISANSFFGLPLTARFSNASQAAAPESDSELSQLDKQPADFSLEKTALAEQKPALRRSYDRLLLGIGCVSVVVTTAMWLLFQEINRQPASVSAPPQTTANSSPQVGDPFASYMQRSLQAIDQKTQPPSSTVATANSSSASSLPTVTVPGSRLTGTASVPTIPGVPTLGTAARTPAASGHIYIPVYQVPSGMSSQPATAPSPSSVTPLPGTSTKPGATAIKPPIPLSVPGVARTLEGVVDMGEQSAILIKINGVTQRFRLGESIGSSGWALVEVSKNQAIIRRNGEVRSLFIGQSF
jgi:hypothetical protein